MKKVLQPEVEEMFHFCSNWDNTNPPTLQDFIRFGLMRDVPNLRGMPPGIHLNLGAGRKRIGHSIPVGLEEGINLDYSPIPYADETIAGIWALHIFEHFKNPVYVLWECQRVLQPGGILNIVTPHALSNEYPEDINHVAKFTEETWWHLFDNPFYDTSQSSEPIEWKFDVQVNLIMSTVWRNLCLFTQLVRTDD